MQNFLNSTERSLRREVAVLVIGCALGCPLGVFAARLLMPAYFNGHTSQIAWWTEEAPFITLAGFVVGAFASVALVRQRQNNQ